MVDALDGRTGRIDDFQPAAPQGLIGLPRNAVRTDHNGTAFRNLRGVRHDGDAKPFKMLHKMAVVGDRAKGHHRFSRLDRLFHQIDCAFHAVAEARRCGYADFHSASPSL